MTIFRKQKKRKEKYESLCSIRNGSKMFNAKKINKNNSYKRECARIATRTSDNVCLNITFHKRDKNRSLVPDHTYRVKLEDLFKTCVWQLWHQSRSRSPNSVSASQSATDSEHQRSCAWICSKGY